MSGGQMRAKGLVTAAVCAAALVAAGMATAATRNTVAPRVNCAKLMPAPRAASLTKLSITSVTATTKAVKGGWYSSCRYHTATDTGSSSAISLDIYPMTAAKRTAFMKGLVKVAALATKAFVAPQCQPAYKVPEGSPPVDPSDCIVMHPFGPDSYEFGSVGLVYGTAKYFVDDVSIHGDTAQEALMRAVIAKLH